MNAKTKTKDEPVLFQDGQAEIAQESPPAKPIAKRTAKEVVPLPPPTNILAIIASAAANPNVDVEKMRALLAMQREIMAEDARIAFTEAFIRMKLPTINKDGKIDEGTTRSGRQGKKTRYATFEAINNAVEPLLKENGFAMWFEPDVGDDGKIIMRGHLDHIKGHGKTCAISLPLETSGSKNNVQGVGSSISYGKRYAAIALLNIVSHAPEDRDLDGNEPEKKIDENQVQQVADLIVESGSDRRLFCKYFGIEKVEDMPLNKFDDAVASLEKKKAARP